MTKFGRYTVLFLNYSQSKRSTNKIFAKTQYLNIVYRVCFP